MGNNKKSGSYKMKNKIYIKQKWLLTKRQKTRGP